MQESSERGSARDLRSSALWGTGGRGGDSRSSALWGKGGRGAVQTALAVLVLGIPLAATAGSIKKPKAAPPAPVAIPNLAGQSFDAVAAALKSAGFDVRRQDVDSSEDKDAVLAMNPAPGTTVLPGARITLSVSKGNLKADYVAPDLTDRWKKRPDDLVDVIVQSSGGLSDARGRVRRLNSLLRMGHELDLVNGVAAQLRAKDVERLSKIPGLSITPDAPVRLSGPVPAALNFTSTQLWPHENGNSGYWRTITKAPTIAIVDSGVDAGRADFGGRVLTQVNFTTLPENSPGDGRGHGTFVAGIAAGSARDYAGAAPTADIVSLDVMDDHGMARTSDVITACSWILQNKDKYNIKIANFSLHSTYPSNFGRDPLDQAVEKLWLSGIVVVAASGNYGTADTPSGVKYAPGNDPFVITVGAVDLNGSGALRDDGVAPWSAFGRTYDGFWKPEVGAAGRFMVGPVPVGSTLPAERPTKVVAPGYMELSGTSFAAPVVAGTAAQLLALHPTWTPDQIKGALMVTTKRVPKAVPYSAGAGQINADRAARVKNPPNPNLGLLKFVKQAASGGGLVFDAVSWYDAAKADVSWNSVSWADVSWSDVSWADVSWSSVSWADVSWSDVSWADVSWADSAREDAVGGEPEAGSDVFEITPEDLAEILADDPAATVDPAAADLSATAVATGTTAAPATGTGLSTPTTTTTTASATTTTSAASTPAPAGTSSRAAATGTAVTTAAPTTATSTTAVAGSTATAGTSTATTAVATTTTSATTTTTTTTGGTSATVTPTALSLRS